MSSYIDIILVVLLAVCAFYALTGKDMVGKSKSGYYTKESRDKFGRVAGIIYAAASLLSLVYALGNHGVIGFKLNLWVYYIVLLLLIVIGIYVSEKLILQKTEEEEAKDSLKNGGDEDF